MKAGTWLCLKPNLLVVFCSRIVRSVILGLQAFCVELRVTKFPVYSSIRVVAYLVISPSGWLVLWGPTRAHSVAQWKAPKFPPKATGCKERLWNSLSPHCRNSVISPNFPFYPLWHPLLHPHRIWAFWVPVLRHQIILTLEGCFVESPNKLLQMYLLI